MESLLHELWLNILENAKNIKTLIRISVASKFFLRVVRTGNWSSIKVHIKNQINLEYMLSTYKFKNIDLGYTNITPLLADPTEGTGESVSKLGGCRTLNLGRTKITPLRGPHRRPSALSRRYG